MSAEPEPVPELEIGPPSLADLRVRYSRAQLGEADVAADPLEQFQKWFGEAVHARVPEPNAFTLSTVEPDGQPSGRVVLLKGLHDGRFVFFTNYTSRKGRDLAATPRAAMTWHWHELERQVCVQGTVSQVERAETVEYFHSRPRESQLGAWASHQSSIVPSREHLEDRFAELTERWAGQPIPVPDFWGGYAITPHRVEFWQGRPGRLHDRIVYLRPSPGQLWDRQRLAP